MAVNPIYEKLASVKRINPEPTQVVVECTVQSNDEIKNILGVSAGAFIKSCNMGKNGIDFSGVVNFKVLFNNTDNVPSALNYMAEFNDKVSVNTDMMSENMVCIGNVVDVKVVNSTSDSVKLSAIVQISAMVTMASEVNALTEVIGDDVFSVTNEINNTKFAGTLNLPINFSDNLSIKDSVSTVLSVTVNSVLKQVEGGNGYIKVSADADVEICYVTDGENATVRTFNQVVNVNEEINAEYVTDSSMIEAYLENNIEAMQVSTNIDVDNAQVDLTIQFVLKGFVFDKTEVNVITDIFSTTNEITTSTASFDNLNFGGMINFDDKINCSVTITDEMPFADEVLAVCEAFNEITNSYISDGTLTVEGMVRFNVLYFNRENMNVVSVISDCPFMISANINDEFNNFKDISSLTINDIAFKCRRGKEIEITANAYVSSNVLANENSAVISSIEIGEEKPENDCAMSVYFVQLKETIWDVAKRMNVSPDMILEQNPGLELPLVGGEKIFIYRKKNVEF